MTLIRGKRVRLVPRPLRVVLYKRKGWYFYWTLVGNVKNGPAHELRSLRIYLRSNEPLWRPARALLLGLIRLYLRSAPEVEPSPGLRAKLAEEKHADRLLHDTTGYEEEGLTEVTFFPRYRREPRQKRREIDDRTRAMTLPGPSRTIIVEPIEQPGQPERSPAQPEREPAEPEKAPAEPAEPASPEREREKEPARSLA